jgi:pyruvate dehydrogenase E2 component (dihydrolipoamide acetyltransferase)
MAEFCMPSLGADMEDGVLYDWRIKPGDRVKRGDIIVSVETDKGVIDVEVFEDGVVEQIFVTEGTRVPVGEPLALIQAVDEAALPVPETAVPTPPEPQPLDRPVLVALPKARPEAARNGGGRQRVSPAARRRAAELDVDLTQVKGTGPDRAITINDVEQAAAPELPAAPAAKRPRVSPVARRLAAELGLDLSLVKGSGPQGTINRTNVEQAAAAMIRRQTAQPAESPPPEAAKPVQPETAVDPAAQIANFQAGMRRAIAAAMSRANRDIPHYYLETRMDMTRALQWLEAENLNRSLKERILPVVVFIKAVAKALSNTPQLNGYWVDDQLQVQEAIHIGFAIALRQGGLVTPAIHHADAKSLDELMAAMRDLITRTRSGRLRSSELTDATVTLTSLGDTGVEKVYGVIYPPQVALIGLGKINEQPWAEKGMIGVRPVITATLAGDHRATDGRIGGQFLTNLDKQLQEPEKL